MSQTTTLPVSHGLTSDRGITKPTIHHSPRLISPPTPRSHSSSMNLYSSSSTPNSSHQNQSVSSAMTPSYTSSMNTPTKYDFSVNGPHLHSTPSSLSTGTGNSYMHSNQLAQTTYGNVKSESNASSNYEYMNSCIQSGYFGGSFGSLGTPAGAHVATDLAGYHHQHNVIQAAKLMASS